MVRKSKDLKSINQDLRKLNDVLLAGNYLFRNVTIWMLLYFWHSEGIFQNKTIGLKSLGVEGYEKTVEQISKAKSVREKIDLLETWLIKTVAKNDVTPVGYTEYVLSKIISAGGKVPLKKILSGCI